MKHGYQLGLYEKSMPNDLTWAQKLQAAKDAGFDYVEMSVDESDARLARLDWTDGERDALRAAMRATGVRIGSICLSGHRKYPLGDPDAAKRAQPRDHGKSRRARGRPRHPHDPARGL